ncbi:hypothetical protein HRR83_007268 [Exophiala dermatitidis]|uniref:Uncharacterized protein n=2 Tax=Exophiala dermatitidis TaxID=5970 RepID=H6C401_EXODN|nr:uncharacterized protein HMPREF1120_06378 [Exophiala dermatitidis NIH/UT8656]KAJ4509057.1 hypothetical protein HRR75_006026 [Exophiala dermatitidis]EHY58366.1 hypothetical protein HMPREF1120_06378 [Exophiala dermatitidis NIH/UT8656]KAJ4511226.1 hypothetical protein HRR73_006559 [Exophiala dermatitidis]KAJ4511838.1 hypothetical protein HRR74_006572 [Exophiala dermatitidis]KAJ4534694.1 hypothetical protein HRR76_006608 [Exophiala dermatitidis]
MSTNATPWDTNYGSVSQINCVYPISGTYGPLPRFLYYVTLVFAIFGRRREWLVIGALVSALTYAGTAAIHMMALVKSKQGVFDLDIMAAWAVLSTGALAYIGIIHWSSTLRDSRARIVMIFWGFLVGVGLVIGRAILFDAESSPPEPACYSSKGKLLEYPMELISPEFNCTYKCFSLSKPMRQQSEIQAVPRSLVDNTKSRSAYVLVGPIQFAAYAALSIDVQNHTPSMLCQRIVLSYLIHPGQREEMAKTVYNASMERWYGGYFALLGYVGRIHWDWKKFCLCSIVIPYLCLSLIVDALCLPLMVANIVVNEITLLSNNMPVNESNRAVGQWSPIVNSMLVVIAACINRLLELYERRQRTKKLLGSVLEGGDLTYQQSDPSEEQANFSGKDGQRTGVTKPSPIHVHTLKDMEDWRKQPG